MFYSYHNLQGSQTMLTFAHNHILFYSYHNLQGSQTQYDFKYYTLLVLLLS